MKGKLGAAFFCLLFALPFGSVGVFASWAIATMVYDGIRAQDWVRVKADVTGESTYRYTFKGATYTSERLGVLRMGGTDNVDDFHDRMADFFAQAREQRKPITVYVNPDEPSEAMVDRGIRWLFVLFLLPFALGFGGVGVGAAWVLTRIFRGSPETKTSVAAAKPPSGLAGLWVVAFFWNVIAFPIAALVVPDVVRNGEWIGLLVLLFPLIGLVMLFAAIKATFNRLVRGRPEIEVATRTPRIGEVLEGHATFTKGVRSGDRFNVRLVCLRESGGDENPASSPYWSRHVEARAQHTGSSARVAFRFEIPAGLPPSSEDEERPVNHRWRLEVSSAGSNAALYAAEDIEVEPAASGAPALALEPAPAGAGFDSLEKLFGGRLDVESLTPGQKAAFAQLGARHQEAVAKVVHFAPHMKKVIIAVVCLLVALEFAPLLFSLFGGP